MRAFPNDSMTENLATFCIIVLDMNTQTRKKLVEMRTLLRISFVLCFCLAIKKAILTDLEKMNSHEL